MFFMLNSDYLFFFVDTHARTPETAHIHTKWRKPAAAFLEKMRKAQRTGWQLKQRQSVSSSSLAWLMNVNKSGN